MELIVELLMDAMGDGRASGDADDQLSIADLDEVLAARCSAL